MLYLHQIYRHLAEKKSVRFTDKRKAEMLSKEIADTWEKRDTILAEADSEEITELVLATRTHLPLLLALVKKVDSVVVLNALIALKDIENTRQVLQSLKPEENKVDKVDKGEDDDDDDYSYKKVLNDPPLVTAIMTEGVTIEMIEMLLQEGCDPNSMIANRGALYEIKDWRDTNNSSLYCALHQGRNDIVKLLLDKGATVTNDHYTDDRDHAGSADIIECIDDYAMVKLLLDHGADPNSSYYQSEDSDVIPDNTGTALINAIFQGNLPVVQLLIERGADVNKLLEDEDYWGNAVSFAYSVACGSASETWEIKKLNHMSTPVFWNEEKSSADRSAIFELVIKNNDTSSDINYGHNNQLLRDAMLRPNCQEFAQMILDSDYNVNVTEELSNEFKTPLLCILMKYKGYRGTTTRADFLEFCHLNPKIFDASAIKKLVSGPTINNADIFEYCKKNYIDSDKIIFNMKVGTPLYFSDVLSGVLPQLGQLITKTTDINAAGNSENHESPLHCAVECRSPAVVAMLLADKRINVDVQDEGGNTPLECCRYSKFDLVLTHMLLEAKCTVDHQNLAGETVLFQICAWHKDDSTNHNQGLAPHTLQKCEMLLKAGADPNIADLEGDTPVSVLKNTQLALLLFKYGGDGTKVQDAQCKLVYQEYRTRLNDENKTLGLKDMPQLVRTRVQGWNGVHCTRCNKLITGDSREDGDGQMCMECFGKAARTATKTKETNPLYTQWIKTM
jgi:ankyrin repeat protein